VNKTKIIIFLLEEHVLNHK